ncbi:e12b4f45-8d9b-4018-a6f8-f8b4cc09bc35 [Thermothielavioides terrestris]|uniref:E12b4f45-8d9b-4018-a6f8-f8b4cc09bc35 n=1 Tax=Thermothielavioides terrestris TaxID=2587410 RepID=A0A446BVM8_9PEZI|nr:e12b4f45-8d9b-4018-a6f8-f8b4cc09bc35 [Thermothielavioides terrestris]
MKLLTFLAVGAGFAASAPLISERQAGSACFIIGNQTLPQETADAVKQLQSTVTCDSSRTTISGVPDVSSGGVTFSSINFAASPQTPLQFALSRFATPTPLRDADLATFQNQLNVYLATEAGIRSVGGSLAIKVPKFFLEFQVSRIQTAQGNPPAAAGLQVDHLLQKVLKNAAGESQQLLDQVTALAKVLE